MSTKLITSQSIYQAIEGELNLGDPLNVTWRVDYQQESQNSIRHFFHQCLVYSICRFIAYEWGDRTATVTYIVKSLGGYCSRSMDYIPAEIAFNLMKKLTWSKIFLCTRSPKNPHSYADEEPQVIW